MPGFGFVGAIVIFILTDPVVVAIGADFILASAVKDGPAQLADLHSRPRSFARWV